MKFANKEKIRRIKFAKFQIFYFVNFREAGMLPILFRQYLKHQLRHCYRKYKEASKMPLKQLYRKYAIFMSKRCE